MKEKALLKKGDLLNADKLDLERIRITEILQNNGYFNFKRENIFFKLIHLQIMIQLKFILKLVTRKINYTQLMK